jgi:uncharacterized protein YbjT (DUF2867 family)
MKKVMLFGATGNLGKEIARELTGRGYDLTVAVRNEERGRFMQAITKKYVVANVRDKESLVPLLRGQDIVISALGKSVSPNDRSRATFREIDYEANANILEAAKQTGIKKFVYVSAFRSEDYQHLEYFKVHHDFSELLKRSGLDYSIVKPPAIFSAYADMFELARKGRLVTMGKGDKRTNPIFEGDLARVVVDAIQHSYSTTEAGGKRSYTRKQLNEIIQAEISKDKTTRAVPLGLVKAVLPLIRIFDRNTYDKFAFFTAVMQEDALAPPVGEMSFEDYVKIRARELPGS